MINYSVGVDNIHVEDSYTVRRCGIGKFVRFLRANYESEVFRRSNFSLSMEWAVHNVLYRLGYKRSQTKDVDLDYPCDRPEWLYCVLGVFCWIFLWFLI